MEQQKHPEMKLDGAVFGLYSPDAADAMKAEDYEKLKEKLDKTLNYQEKTWHIMDVKLTQTGDITWEGCFVRTAWCWK